jgi:hypothetical protein
MELLSVISTVVLMATAGRPILTGASALLARLIPVLMKRIYPSTQYRYFVMYYSGPS